ncbi:MAG: ribosome biogenesis GTPase Der [SAR202 cluster bacterium]|nr:ribosome biogenesis GTPase Der [SAR202 cluster bacterium]
MKPLVAIVGRPNVGKSTLFNRVTGRRTAIVSDTAGTTRDRVALETVWGDHAFDLVDTGGLDAGSITADLAPKEIWQQIRTQIDVAISEAQVIIMVVDINDGVTPSDRDIAEILRRSGKPIVLVANKADNEAREAQIYEFYELSIGEPIPLSAYHNIGVDDMMGKVIGLFPNDPEFPEPDADLKIAIVGRTNAGKSMLVNSILGEDRSIVSDVPGTTRDAIDSLFVRNEERILIVDTAGIRRRGSIKPGIERYSTLRSIRAIDRAHVAVLVLDATELATAQDTHIASYILDSYKGIVIAVNKWDLADELQLNKKIVSETLLDRFMFARYAPICYISAANHNGIDQLLDTVKSVSEQWHKGVPRYDLRRTVMNAIAANPPATAGKHAAKIYSVAQDATSPPSFTFYVNRAEMVHFGYQRYLENVLREAYGFNGSPLRMRFKGRRD